jgi:hypothetical protein
MKIYKYGTAICCRVYFFHLNFARFAIFHIHLYSGTFIIAFLLRCCTLDSRSSTYDIIRCSPLSCSMQRKDHVQIMRLSVSCRSIYCPRPSHTECFRQKFFIFFSMARTSCGRKEREWKIYAIIWRHIKKRSEE